MTIQYNLDGEWFDYLEVDVDEPILDNILSGNFTIPITSIDIKDIGKYNGVYNNLNEFLFDMFTNHISDWRYI